MKNFTSTYIKGVWASNFLQQKAKRMKQKGSFFAIIGLLFVQLITATNIHAQCSTSTPSVLAKWDFNSATVQCNGVVPATKGPSYSNTSPLLQANKSTFCPQVNNGCGQAVLGSKGFNNTYDFKNALCLSGYWRNGSGVYAVAVGWSPNDLVFHPEIDGNLFTTYTLPAGKSGTISNFSLKVIQKQYNGTTTPYEKQGVGVYRNGILIYNQTQNIAAVDVNENPLTFTFPASGDFTSDGSKEVTWTIVFGLVHRLNQNVTGYDDICIAGICGESPASTAAIMPATCGTGSANNDGKITLTNFGATDKYDFNTGNTYTGGKTYATATTVPGGGVITSTLPNPATPTIYTVRIFTSAGCTTDLQVTLNPTLCSGNSCTAPTATVTSTAATCSGLSANNNASIAVTGISGGEKVGLSLGTAYNGPSHSAAQTPAGGAYTFSALPNSNGSQAYTVRIFNADDNCFKDYPVTINETSCGCKKVVVQVIKSDQADPNSTPNNSVTTEDDLATYEVCKSNGYIDLQLAKSVSPTTATTCPTNTPFVWTLTLTNAGTMTATNVKVADDMPLELLETAYTASPGTSYNLVSGWLIPSLAPNTSVTLTITTKAIKPGTYQNCAWVNNAFPLNDPDSSPLNDFTSNEDDDACATITVTGAKTPEITKEFSPGSAKAGVPIRLTIKIVNNESTPISMTAALVDILPNTPAQMVIAPTPNLNSEIAGIIAAAGGTSITVPNGTVLLPGINQIQIDVVAPSDGTYCNKILSGALKTSSCDNLLETEACIDIKSTYVLAPLIKKTFSPSIVEANQNSILTITIENRNAASMTIIQALIDNLPSGLVLAGATSGTCPNIATFGSTDQVGITSASIIPPGSCTIIVPVKSTTAGEYCNKIIMNSLIGVVSNGTIDVMTGNEDIAEACLKVVSAPIFDLALRKKLATGQASNVTVGDNVNYTITVFNQGTADATNVQITDYIPSGMSLVASSTWTLNGSDAVLTTPIALLKAGESTTVNITLKVDAATNGSELINISEISAASGGTDIDSTPDGNKANDKGGKTNSPTDDVIAGNGNGSGGAPGDTNGLTDEDDADPASITVTGCTPITPTFTQLGPYCQNATAAALPTTSSNGISGTWNPASISTAATGTTTYTFTPTAGQCATTATMSVVVDPNVTPTFTQLGPYCQNVTAAALPTTSSNGISGTWNPASISTATTGTTTYTFTPTAGQCATTATMSVVVNPNAIPTFTQLGSYCQNATAAALPTTSSNGISGTWNPASISTATTGTTTYTFTPTAGQCATTATMSVVVSTSITPTFTQEGPYCQNAAAATLPTTSSNGISGTWNPASISTAATGTTTYTFTPTAGQCATTATMSVVVSTSITPTFTQEGPYCQNATAAALPTTSSNGISGTWNPASISTATTGTTTYTFAPTAGQCATTATMSVVVSTSITPTFTQEGPYCQNAAAATLPTTSSNGISGTWNPASISTAATGTTTYTFTPTAGQCATTATMSVVVSTSITPTFTQLGPYCQNATADALPTTSSNGITGTWNPASISTAATGTTTYTFTPTAGQCGTTATMSVVVNPNVAPTFTQEGPYCQNATAATLPTISSNGISGTWNPASISTATTGTTTYTFTPTAGQCATTATLSVVVNPNVTPTFTQLGPYCQNATAEALPTTSTNGISGTWNPASISTVATGTTTYTFTPTAGQCATTATLSVVVNPNVTPTFTQLGPYCQNATAEALPTTSTNGISGTWNPASISTVATGTTTYTFTPTTAGQCATTATMSVVVNPNLTPTFPQLGPYCQNATAEALPTTSSNGISGTWNPASISTAATGTTTYTFTPTAGQCATTATMSVVVNPNVAPTFTQLGPYCQNATAETLPTTSSNGISGTWNPASISTAATGTTTYTFTPTAGQCGTTSTMTITVTPNTTPTFAPVSAICTGGTLSALPTTSLNGIIGTWSPALNNAGTTTYTFTPTAGVCATTATLTISVTPCVSVGSTVFIDTNNDGKQLGTGELGISGVTVNLYKDANADGFINGAEDTTPFANMLTDGDGNYIFKNLIPGKYKVGVIPNAGYPTNSTGASSSQTDDLFENGIQASFALGAPAPETKSDIVDLAVGTMPTGSQESSQGGNQDDASKGLVDADGNMTIDFGFYHPMSIGSTVFIDANNDGVQGGAGEIGISGLLVKLYAADGTTVIATTNTDGNGNYLFTGLSEGNYIVGVVPSPTYPTSSYGNGTDNQIDGDDNGIQTAPNTEAKSPIITLELGTEPTASQEIKQNGSADDSDDSNGDMTIDFGFFRPVEIGSTVFEDKNGNGIQDVGDTGLSGVTVKLYKANGTTPATGADGLPISTTTNTNGNYFFSNLVSGTYVVGVTPKTGFTLSSLPGVTDTNDNQQDGDDNGIQANNGDETKSPQIVLAVGTEPIEPSTYQGYDLDDTFGDNTGDMTVDFGFISAVSVGSTVFADKNNNGVQDSGELGIAGQLVTLYDPSNNVIATTTTDPSGNYLFQNLPQGQYKIGVKPTTPNTKASTPVGGADDQVDSDNNGTQSGGDGSESFSGLFTLTSNGETQLETGQGGDQDTSISGGDFSGDMTIDFGFYTPVSIGSTVFIDINNNGKLDSGEGPISGVMVKLYDETGLVEKGNTTTNSNGNYIFKDIPEGKYIVGVTPDAVHKMSSTPPAAGDDGASGDGKNHGTQSSVGAEAKSSVITLTAGAEPTGSSETTLDTTPGGVQDTNVAGGDSSGDMTIDFGFYIPVSIGSTVFIDKNNNGIQDSGELGIPNATVKLYKADGTTQIGASKVTDANGDYIFNDLSPASYVVGVIPVAAYPKSSTDIGTSLADNQTDGDDNGVQPTTGSEAKSPVIALLAGAEPIVEPVQGGTQDNTADDAGDMTIDFGFYMPVSIGSTVFNDKNNNGTQDAGDSGIPGLTVKLYKADGTTVIATTTTDPSGNYKFTDLPPGDYVIGVMPNTTYPKSSTTTGTTDNQTDGDDNGSQPSTGLEAKSPIITLLSGTEPTTEPGSGGNQDDTADDSGDMTVDFGFFAPVSIGSTVFSDNNNNGIQDSGELGIPNATVKLYKADGSTQIGASLVTDVNGNYLFSDLEPGSYVVGVMPTATYPRSSTDIATSAADNQVDGDDNGIQTTPGTEAKSPVIVLLGGSEPTTEASQGGTQDNAADSDGDMTVDFGFFAPVSIGSTVFIDTNNNGIQDAGEMGIPNATVKLYKADGTTQVGASKVTDTNGDYIFADLLAGSYVVGVTPVAAYPRSSTDIVTTNSDNQTDGDDNGVQATAGNEAKSPVIALAIATEPTTEPKQGGMQDDLLDANGDMTIDFGFYRPVSIGSTVFIDSNNDGIQSGAGESGISGLVVKLYKADGTTVVATTTTDGNGNYIFKDVLEGSYVVGVLPSLGYPNASTIVATSDNQIDGDSNGTQPSPGTESKSPVIVLIAGTEPTAEPNQGGIQDNLYDSDGDMTIDFGFFKPMSLGSTVFIDANNNGMQDGVGETGISSVVVNLYKQDGTTLVSTQNTDGNGNYLFTGLAPGKYVVGVVPNVGYPNSSTDIATSLADNQVDSDDNGIQVSSGAEAKSPIITLSEGAEPTSESGQGGNQDNAADNQGDMTIDFGFYKPVSIGSTVFEDKNNNGIQGVGEAGIAGAMVQLYKEPGSIPVGAAVPTDLNGNYMFAGLAPGNYSVGVMPVTAFPRSSTDISTTTADNQTDGDDNGVQTAEGTMAKSPVISLLAGAEPTTEATQGGTQDDVADNDGDMTIDFGFYAKSTVEIGDPCTCHDIVYERGDNSELLDVLIVHGPATKPWTITNQTGMQEISADFDIPITIGTQMVEVSPGLFEFEFAHDAVIGYTVEVSNGTEVLTFGNACNVSKLTTNVDQMLTICVSAAPLTLSAAAKIGSVPSTGTITFDIIKPDNSILANSTVLNPALFKVGDVIIVQSKYTPAGSLDCPLVYNYPITITTTGCAGPLTVNLLKFEGKVIEDKVNLTWTTANETNFSHYEVQRSADAKEFASIGKVDGIHSNIYNLTDSNPSEGINYYRLKMVDADGTFSFSKVLSFDFIKGENYIVVENPAVNGEFTVTTNIVNPGFNLVSLVAANIPMKVIKIENNKYLIRVPNHTAGSYYLSINSKSEVVTRRVIIP